MPKESITFEPKLQFTKFKGLNRSEFHQKFTAGEFRQLTSLQACSHARTSFAPLRTLSSCVVHNHRVLYTLWFYTMLLPRSFENPTALALHKSWHSRGKDGVPTNQANPGTDPMVVLNRVEGKGRTTLIYYLKRRLIGVNTVEGDEVEMEMELDSMAMLEVGIGDEPVEVRWDERHCSVSNTVPKAVSRS